MELLYMFNKDHSMGNSVPYLLQALCLYHY